MCLRSITFGLRADGLARIFAPMKRYVLVTALCACLVSPLARAQDSPAINALKEEAEERYKTFSARLENLEEALLGQQKRMSLLAEEVRSIREELTRLSSNTAQTAATQKNLEKLAEAINEVDRKRQSDNEKVLATVTSEMKKILAERPSGSPRGNPTTATSPPRPATERGYEYTVQANDNAAVIASKYGKQGVKVTAKQIIDANPGVNWTKLKIGQKVFVPAPAP